MPDSDDIGDIGELELCRLARQRGITPNRPKADRKGWDVLLELPMVRLANPSFSLDLLPGALSCKVQVKTTMSDNARISLKLSNWHLMVTDSTPWFVARIVLDESLQVVDRHLIHVNEHWTASVLKRMRELDVCEAERLHKHELELKWNDDERLDAPEAEALEQRLRDAIGTDATAYAGTKKRWWQRVGYDESRRKRVQFTPGESPDFLEEQADFAIGLRARLPIARMRVEDLRFDLPKLEKDIVFQKDDYIELHEVPSLGISTVRLSRRDRSLVTELACQTHASWLIFPDLPPHRGKVRLACGPCSVIIRVTRPDSLPADQLQMTVSWRFGVADDEAIVSVQRSALVARAVRLLAGASVEPIRIEVECDFDERIRGFERDDFTTPDAVDPGVARFWATMERAWIVSTGIGLPADVQAAPRTVAMQQPAIDLMAAALNPDVRTANFRTIVDRDSEVPDTLGLVVCPTAQIGDHIAGMSLAIVGGTKLEKRTDGRIEVQVVNGELEIVDRWCAPAGKWSDAETRTRARGAREEMESRGVEWLVSPHEADSGGIEPVWRP